MSMLHVRLVSIASNWTLAMGMNQLEVPTSHTDVISAVSIAQNWLSLNFEPGDSILLDCPPSGIWTLTSLDTARRTLRIVFNLPDIVRD